jgi:hypothetical protein
MLPWKHDPLLLVVICVVWCDSNDMLLSKGGKGYYTVTISY